MVIELRRLGHDVLTSLEAGNANAAIPDQQVVAFASSVSRVLLSHNRRHFLRLHHERVTDHEGMILLTLDADFTGQAMRIHQALATLPDIRNQDIQINRPR